MNTDMLTETVAQAIHSDVLKKCMQLFDGMVGIGSESAIKRARCVESDECFRPMWNHNIFHGRANLKDDIEAERQRFFDSNSHRNPFKNVEFYMLPLIIASAAWIIAVIIDNSCSTDICEVSIPML